MLGIKIVLKKSLKLVRIETVEDTASGGQGPSRPGIIKPGTSHIISRHNVEFLEWQLTALGQEPNHTLSQRFNCTFI